MEPPSQVEQDERRSETPGRRPIPPRGPISPVTPAEPSFPPPPAPAPERSTRRSSETYPEQQRPPSIATQQPPSIATQQPREPYGPGPSQVGSQDYPFPSRQSTLRETPGAGLPAGNGNALKGAGSAKTFENLKRAAAGVHVSQKHTLLCNRSMGGNILFLGCW